MKYFKCPHCGEETISIVKKAFVDVRRIYKCKKCNGAYGIPWLAGAAQVTTTILVSMYILENVQNITIKVFLFMLIASLDVFINIAFMPIIKK